MEAAHLVGGEMSYECLGNGDYRIRLKIYRDCNSTGAPFDDSVAVAAFNNLPLSGYPEYANIWLTHGAIIQLPNNLNNPCLQAPPNVCTEFTVYQGILNLPPASGGYVLAHQRCCRNQTVDNVPNSGDWGNTFITSIPSNDNCNNSPSFNNNPPLVMCQNDSLRFDHSASELDGDSLHYSLCNAFHGGTRNDPAPFPIISPPYTTIPFVAGQNANNPIPANPAISINPNTGLLRGRPNTQGQFLFTVCVEEYRNGQLLSTVRRDFQINVVNCQSNVISQITPQSQMLNSSLCNGTTVTFEHTSTGGQFYQWDFDDAASPAASSTLGNPTFTFSDTGTFTITLIVNPNTPCADTSQEVFVLRYPVEPIADLQGGFCINDQNISLSAGGNLSPLASVVWDVDGQTYTGFNVNLPPVVGTGPFSVELNVLDFGCWGSDSTSFSLRQKPGIYGTLNNESGCVPLTIEFNDSSSVDADINHLWDFGDGRTSSQPIPTHTYNQAGVYTVRHAVWSDTACVDSVFNSYPQVVEALPTPVANIYADPLVASIYEPFFVLSDSSSQDVVSRGTSMGDGTDYSNETYWSHAYSDTGVYEVSHWVTNSSGCTDTATLTLLVDPEFRVFIPSAFRPNGDEVNEFFRPFGSGWRKMEFYVLDRWGTRVFTSKTIGESWNGRMMNTGDLLPEGVYSWRIIIWGKRGNFEERFGTVTLLR